MLFRASVVIAVSLVVSGCASHAGPYVTNISSDGRGGLIVEKCMAKFDPWMSTVNNDKCSTTVLHTNQESARSSRAQHQPAEE